MGELIDQITTFLGGILGSPLVQLGLRAIAIYVVILWLAAAYWAFRDMQLRTANPILPYFAATLVIVFTPVFFPFAVVAYRIVRPQEKIGEVYERTLAEEALLAEVESVKSCPTCARRINDDWIICPTCRTRLNRVCPNCSKLVGLDWSLCAWCGRDFDRAATGFEAPAAPSVAALPAREPSYGRASLAPANDTPSYRSPAALGLSGNPDRSPYEGAHRDDAPLTGLPARSSSPGVRGGAATMADSEYDDLPVPIARSSDRATGPSDAGLDGAPLAAAPSRSGRVAPQRSTAKGQPKATRPATDPLPER